MRGRLLAAIAVASLVAAAPAAAAERPWLPNVDLSAPGQNAQQPQVALDAGEGAVAVWRRFDGANWVAQSAAHPPGGSWSPAQTLSAPGFDIERPQIAVDPAGDAVAIWSRPAGEDAIQVVSKPAGASSWSLPGQISRPGDGDAAEPQLAFDAAGNAYAVWSSAASITSAAIEFSRRPAGTGAWTLPVPLSSGGKNDQPQLAVDAAGDAVVVWRHAEAGPTVVQAARMAAGGAWSPPVPLSTAGGSAEQPQVALDPAGNAVAVWRRLEGSSYIAQRATAAPGLPWSGPIDLSASGHSAETPQVAAGPGGEAVAVWAEEGSGFAKTIQSSWGQIGAAWPAAVNLTAPTELAEAPQVALGPAGEAVALWTVSRAVPVVVEGSSKPAGGSWSPPELLSELGHDAAEPQIAIDPHANRVAIWQRSDGANTIVQATAFDGAPPHFSSLSVPAAANVTRPVAFSASAFDAWTAVGQIVWDFGDGGAASGASVSHVYASTGTYRVTATVTDARGFSASTSATITIFPKASAFHFAPVKHGKAQLKLHCPSLAPCEGEVNLKASAKGPRHGSHGRRFGRRVSIGSRPFSIPPSSNTVVPVRLSRKGLALVAHAGRRGLKCQLTGPGVKHRVVVLLAKKRHKRR